MTRLGSRRTASHAARSVAYVPRSSRIGAPPSMNRRSNAVTGHSIGEAIPLTRKSPAPRASGATFVTPSSAASCDARTESDEREDGPEQKAERLLRRDRLQRQQDAEQRHDGRPD